MSLVRVQRIVSAMAVGPKGRDFAGPVLSSGGAFVSASIKKHNKRNTLSQGMIIVKLIIHQTLEAYIEQE